MAIGRRTKWIGGGVVGLLLVLVLLAGAGLLWLDTAGGHRFIARQIAGLKFENGMTLKVGRLDGSIYNKLTVHDLAVGDPKGVFLSAPEAEVDWRPFAYLSNHVDIHSLAAPLMRLHRTPEFKEVPSEGPLLPDLDIDVARLDIARIDSIEISRPPLRLPVLVHDRRANALVEIVSRQHPVEDAEFHIHALGHGERAPGAYLPERDGHAGRRTGFDGHEGTSGEIIASRGGLETMNDRFK